MQCKLVIDVERGLLHLEVPAELLVEFAGWAEKMLDILWMVAKATKTPPAESTQRRGDMTDAAAVQ